MQTQSSLLSAVSLTCLMLVASVVAQTPQVAPPTAPSVKGAPNVKGAPPEARDPDAKESSKESSKDGDGAAKPGKKAIRPAGIWYGTPTAPEKKAGAIRIAAYNVENLFDDVDDPTLQGEFDDIKMVTKPSRVQAIADEIKRLDADILCVEEVESLEALTWFRDNYLKDLGYEHLYSEDVGYYRGVEQACLSRFPIKSHAIFVNEDLSDMDSKRDGEGWAGKKADQGKKYQRSPLKLEIDVNGWPLTVYSVHFKAGGKEFEFQRESEALQTVEFVNQDLKVNPNANIVVMGDFNATPSQKAAKVFSEGGMRNSYDFRGVKKGNTKDLYTTHDSGRAIDFMFMSPGLALDAVDGGFFVMGTMHGASDYDWKKDPDKLKVPAGYASDHCPVAIDVMPKDVPAAEAKPGAKPETPAETKPSGKSSTTPKSP